MVWRSKIMNSLWFMITILLLILWILSEIEHRLDAQEHMRTLSRVVNQWQSDVTGLEEQFATLDSLLIQGLGLGVEYDYRKGTNSRGD